MLPRLMGNTRLMAGKVNARIGGPGLRHCTLSKPGFFYYMDKIIIIA